jgi:hypothetical protein
MYAYDAYDYGYDPRKSSAPNGRTVIGHDFG